MKLVILGKFRNVFFFVSFLVGDVLVEVSKFFFWIMNGFLEKLVLFVFGI